MKAPIKKSFNVNADIAQRIDDVVQANPGLSFTFIMNQALASWLSNPSVQVMGGTPRRVSDLDVDGFLNDNSGLMGDLAK